MSTEFRKSRKLSGLKRAAASLASVALGTAICICGCGSTSPQRGDGSVRIGVSLYDQYDTFISELMDSFNSYVDNRKSEGVDIATIVQDASKSQPAQNEDVAEMIENGCNVLCVNLVDRTAPTEIIDTARKNDIPVIFFNRELVEEDLMQWDKLYYVGADAFQSGTLQGEMATEYFKAHPEADRNGDGSIQYVVLEGEAGHQDAIIRTEYSVDTMISNGILLDKVGYAIANWNRAQARSKMEQLIDGHGNSIELVLANNDDMALGAIEAYQGRGISMEEWARGCDRRHYGRHDLQRQGRTGPGDGNACVHAGFRRFSGENAASRRGRDAGQKVHPPSLRKSGQGEGRGVFVKIGIKVV